MLNLSKRQFLMNQWTPPGPRAPMGPAIPDGGGRPPMWWSWIPPGCDGKRGASCVAYGSLCTWCGGASTTAGLGAVSIRCFWSGDLGAWWHLVAIRWMIGYPQDAKNSGHIWNMEETSSKYHPESTFLLCRGLVQCAANPMPQTMRTQVCHRPYPQV